MGLFPKIQKTLTHFWQSFTAVKSNGTEIDFVEEADMISGANKTQVVKGSGVNVDFVEKDNLTAGTQKSQDVDSLGDIVKVDSITRTKAVIPHEHNEIHEGHTYAMEHNASGGSGTKATITFKTPNATKLIHLFVTMRSNVESHYTLGEAATVTGATGTDYVPRNRYRPSANVSTLISEGSAGGAGFATLGATVTNFGLVLKTIHLGNNKVGGDHRSVREWVLKKNTIYAMEVESEAASSDITIEGHFYEHISST